MAVAIWTPDDEYNREELEDLKLAIGLLTGAWTQQGANPAKKKADRHPGKRYFEGELEEKARQAIGRLLRNSKPLDSIVRYQLAELFDGLPPHQSFDAAPVARKIIFENRRAGRLVEVALRDLHLVSDYWTFRSAGMVHQDALDEVCKKYGVSTTAVKDARRRNPLGTVKWFNATKGYGFIKPDRGGADVFVHISAVEKAGYAGLGEGAKISYELVTTRGGKTAAENLRIG
jgi:cold shock protein